MLQLLDQGPMGRLSCCKTERDETRKREEPGKRGGERSRGTGADAGSYR